MALYIKNPDSIGACCDCSVRPLPCDLCTANPCSCSYPASNSFYASTYANAAFIATTFVANCLVYFADFYTWVAGDLTFSADNTTTPNTLVVDASGKSYVGPFGPLIARYYFVNIFEYLSFSALAGETVTIVWSNLVDTSSTTIDKKSVQYTLTKCTREAVSNLVILSPATSGTLATIIIPDDGEYYLEVGFGSGRYTGGVRAHTSSITFTVSGDTTLVINPVKVGWDDSGTTRYIWACPKLRLPPLGGYYANLAAAQAVLTDTLKVSNCIGYAENNPGAPFTSFVATGGTTISLTASGFGAAANTGNMWCSINALAGAIITATTDGNFVFMEIYDDDWNVIYSDFVSSTSISTPALSFGGQFTILAICAGVPGTTSLNYVVSSSSTMSNNTVVGLYNRGTACPDSLIC